MGRQLDFESADAGDPLEGLSIPALTRVTLARFAGASEDYNPLHLDDKVAQAFGKNSVYAQSTLVMSYIGRMVEQAATGTSIRRFSVRVLKLLWPGDVLTCRGAVVDARKEGSDHIVDIDVWCDNQRGETVAKGLVLVAVPKAEGKTLTKAAQATGLYYRVPVEVDSTGKSTRKSSSRKATAKKSPRKNTA